MSTIEKSRVKNAPLVIAEEQSDFAQWAMSIPDGSISAGWQSLHPHLEKIAGEAPASDREGGSKLKW